MIHLSIDDSAPLLADIHPLGAKDCKGQDCGTCNIKSLCDALFNAVMCPPSSEYEISLHNACVRYRDYTDKVCDTYSCPNCPNYSWCTTLRGIAIEGVILYGY